mgnify:CR=1 FL=1
MNFIRKLKLSSLIAAVAVLTGCANIQPKVDAFEQQSKRLGVIYAQVNWVKSPEDWGYCDSSRLDAQAKTAFCRKKDVNVVFVSWVTRGAAATLLQGVSKNIELKPGAIIMLDMAKPLGQNFIGVSSLEETDTCHWTGKANDKIDGSFKTAGKVTGGFVTGALMPIPTLVYLASSVGGTGGIVCNGWNYQEAFTDKNIDALLDIL